MRQLLPLLVIALLSGCGMKGDLYEAPPPAGPTADTDKGERKTIPPAPDPAKTE